MTVVDTIQRMLTEFPLRFPNREACLNHLLCESAAVSGFEWEAGNLVNKRWETSLSSPLSAEDVAHRALPFLKREKQDIRRYLTQLDEHTKSLAVAPETLHSLRERRYDAWRNAKCPLTLLSADSPIVTFEDDLSEDWYDAIAETAHWLWRQQKVGFAQHEVRINAYLARHRQRHQDAQLKRYRDMRVPASDEDIGLVLGGIQKFVRKSRGKILNQTENRSLAFSYPKNPIVKYVSVNVLGDYREGTQWVMGETEIEIYIVTTDRRKGWGFGNGQPAKRTYLIKLDSNPKRVLAEVLKALRRELDQEITPLSASVSGLLERNDLKPKSRGWSTNPNSSSDNFYEVQGKLGPRSKDVVLAWLKENKPGMLPGNHEQGYGASTFNVLAWDKRENAWIITSTASYTGG